MDKVQIIHDSKGAPRFAVLPWDEYRRLRARGDEDSRLIRLAAPHRGEETFPSDVARRLVGGEHPVKVLRGWRKLTQGQLGRKSGVSVQYISQIETGRRNLGRATARKLARVLGVSTGALTMDRD